MCLLEDAFTAVCVSKKELQKNGDVVVPKSAVEKETRKAESSKEDDADDDVFHDTEDDPEGDNDGDMGESVYVVHLIYHSDLR